jgi:hypothetical protein
MVVRKSAMENETSIALFLQSSFSRCGLLIYLGGSPKPRQDVDQQPRSYCPSTIRKR